MVRKKTVLDADDTTFVFVPYLNEFYNGKHGTNFRFEDYHTYSLSEVWGCSQEETHQTIHDFYKSEAFKLLPPLPFAWDVLMELREYRDFIVVSHRPQELTELTREHVRREFFDMDTYCIGTYDFTGPIITKLELCKELGADSIIEDRTLTATECFNEGLVSIVLPQPWNVNVSSNGFHRVEDWREVPKYLP